MAVFYDSTLTRFRVFERTHRFRKGQESVEDDVRQRASVRSRKDENVEHLRSLITMSGRLTLRMMSWELQLNKESIYQMLHKNLMMRKLCAKMVSEMLFRGAETANSVWWFAETFWRGLKLKDAVEWTESLRDDSWLFQYDSETRTQSKSGGRPIKAHMTRSKIKTILVRIGAHFVSDGWNLHLDNAPAHSVFAAQELLTKKQIPTLPHLPYTVQILHRSRQ